MMYNAATSGRCLWIVAFALNASAILGQSYPIKPIRIITSEVGGPADMLSRVIAERVTIRLGQQMIVDNRAGGGGIAGPIVAKASPDGYTLFVAATPLWILPLLRANVGYDPIRDFSPISQALSLPNILVVQPSLSVTSVKDLIALAKARPGELDYGSSAIGTTSHLAAELFKSMAGVNMVRISYKGGGPAMIGIIAGEVQVMFPTAEAAVPHIQSGKLKALGITTAEPSGLLPNMPTIAASGLPGYESVQIIGVFAPASTPATIINRLHQEIVGALKAPDVNTLFQKSGAEVVGSSPEQLTAKIRSEMARMSKVIHEAGIREE